MLYSGMTKFGLLLIAWSLLMSPLPGWANDLELSGSLTQGGLITGHTGPGARVELDGRPLRVSPEGVFVFGFGRDAAPAARLEVIYPDGGREVRIMEVTPRTYEVQRIDGLPPGKVTPPPEVLERIRREIALVARVRSRDTDRPYFLSGFRWPVIGRISGVYGSQRILNGEPRQPHYGIDIAVPTGTAVEAPAAGVVTLVHPDMYFSGGTLIIDHGHGLSSSFLHLQDIHVQEGQAVEQGDTIATVGATGRVTGPHLDWRINWFEQRLDPALVVPPMP